MSAYSLAALRSLWPQSATLLNASLVEQGVEHAGDDHRLACVRAALAAGRRISVSAIGGSITAGSSYAAGSGSAATFLYHHKVVTALDARYPVATGHAHTNGGVPGTGPTVCPSLRMHAGGAACALALNSTRIGRSPTRPALAYVSRARVRLTRSRTSHALAYVSRARTLRARA